jgi:hypothetical protein
MSGKERSDDYKSVLDDSMMGSRSMQDESLAQGRTSDTEQDAADVQIGYGDDTGDPSTDTGMALESGAGGRAEVDPQDLPPGPGVNNSGPDSSYNTNVSGS